MKQAKQTGGGPLKKITTKLVDKHEVFAQLAEIIALSINGHEALEGDEDFNAEMGHSQSFVQSQSFSATSSNNATGNAEMGRSQSFSQSFCASADNSVDFEGFAVMEDEPSNALLMEELITEEVEVVQEATVHEPEAVELVIEPSPDASSTPINRQRFTFQPPKRRRYAMDADVLPVLPVPTVKVDEKPAVKFLNPVACRQPLHKGLKVEKRFVDQDERSEWRTKLGESENQLLLAKIGTERHKLHAAQLQLQFAQDEHKLKMQILREQLAFEKLRKMRERKAMNNSDNSSVDGDDANGHYYDDVDHNDYPNSRNASPNASII